MLLKSRGWTAVVLLSLALGIGANLALFGAINGVLLQKISVRNPDTLVRLRYAGRNQMALNSNDYGPSRPGPDGVNVRTTFSFPMFQTFRAATRTLSDIVGCVPSGNLNVTVGNDTQQATAVRATGNYFSALGVNAALGRTIGPDDDREGAPPVAVVSDRFWRSRLGGDPAAVGRSIRVNGVSIAVVGVLPATFHGIQSANAEDRDLTLPLSIEQQITPVASGSPRLAQATTWWIQIVGRLKPGVTAEQVRAELDGVFQRTAREGLDQYLAALSGAERGLAQFNGRTAVPHLLVDSAAHGVYDANPNDMLSITILTTVVALVLLLVCANVANLLLSRGVTRRKEISIRLSLGATRGRIIWQLLTESALLAAGGAALGIAIGRWGQTLLPGALGRVTGLGWRMAAFLVSVTTLTTLVFGLVPALRATRVNVNESLKESSRGVVESRSVLGRALLVVQVAVSLTLLVGAGLFLQTLVNLRNVDVGFDPNNLVVFHLNLPPTTYPQARLKTFLPEMLARFNAVPGVKSAALSQQGLLAGSESTSTIWVDRHKYSPGEPHDIYRLVVSPDFTETMGIPLIAGRGLSDRDGPDAPKVVMVNQAAAKKFFGVANPVGLHFGFSAEQAGQVEVVGLVRDAKYNDLREAEAPTVYQPFMQQIPSSQTFEVRTAGEPLSIVGALREAVRQMDPEIPITNVTTQTASIEQRYAQETLLAQAYAIFGAIALIVAAIGLFGLMSYSVARRTNEIGIRMALGAEPMTVLRHVMGESMTLVAIGIVAGVGLAFATGRLVSSLLFGVTMFSPETLAAAMAVLSAVSAAASYLPARRASKVDPLVALRSE